MKAIKIQFARPGEDFGYHGIIMLLNKMMLQLGDISWALLPREQLSLSTLSKEMILEIGSHLGWNDRLSLLQVNHQYYKNMAEDWFMPTHYQHQELWSDESMAALSFRKLYGLWRYEDEEGKKGIEEVFKYHKFWPGIELLIKSGRTITELLEKFVKNYVYMLSDEIIEVLFENIKPGTNRLVMLELAIVHVKSPRTIYNLITITGFSILSSVKMDKLCTKKCSYMARFHVAGCLIKYEIVRKDILLSLLASYEKFVPAYLPRVLEEAPLTQGIKLDKFAIHFLHTSDLVSFDLLKLFFSRFPDFRLFLKKKKMMTRWSRRERKEVLAMNISDWCRSKAAFEMTLTYYKNSQDRIFFLDKLGRIDTFLPSKKSIDTFLKSFSEPGLLKLIETFPKIRFTSQHVQVILSTPQISTNTLLQVFQRAPGVYPVVDLDPLGNDEDPTTLIEFAFLFFDRIDSLVYLMRHRISEAYLIGFLKFCKCKGMSLERIRSATEEFGYSDQFIEAFSNQISQR